VTARSASPSAGDAPPARASHHPHAGGELGVGAGGRKRINVGCGMTPTEGWENFDNSPSLVLARHPLLARALAALGVLRDEHRRFIDFARRHTIRRADAKRLPLADRSAEVLYTSHMVEHLDPDEARDFLWEARRVLAPGGVIRILVPDLHKLARRYVAEGDADRFMRETFLGRTKPKTPLEKLRYLLVGDRLHHWMYDGDSLAALLGECGFVGARVLEPGATTIRNPGALDLLERAEESVCVEARCP
jgi:SAM-dependent methyltransferase